MGNKQLGLINQRLGLKIPKSQFRTFLQERCTICIQAKSKQKPIKQLTANPPRVALSTMDCWNADLIGPFSTEVNGQRVSLRSYNGYNYALVIVDEWSRYVMVILLKKKSEASQAVIDAITLKTNLIGKRLKRFHGDGEFDTDLLGTYFRQEGIEHTITVPNTLTKNPIAERYNGKLETLARSLMLHSNAPEEMWTDALLYSAHLMNYTPQVSVHGAIPGERFEGRHLPRMDLTKFHTFGCNAFVVKDKHQPKKLSSQTDPGIYVGYDRVHHADRILMLKTLKIVSRRSVQYQEDSYSHLAEVKNLIIQQAVNKTYEGPDKLWAVSRIDEEKLIKDVLMVRVHWKGFRDPTWEPRAEIEKTCPDLIKELDDMKQRMLVNASVMLQRMIQVAEYKVPNNYNEAMVHPDSDKWQIAIEEELSSIFRSGTGTPTWPVAGNTPLGTQWVFTVKRNDKNEIVRWKARLVVLGNHQKEGINYDETFSPTVHMKSIKLMLLLAAHYDLEIKQLDYVTAFLNASLKEDIYIRIPQGYHRHHIAPGMVLKLNKALYGLKQAPREWYKLLAKTLNKLGYHASPMDEGLFMKKVGNKRIWLTLYVDDTLVFYSKELEVIWETDKAIIQKNFDIKDMGDADWILNMRITRDRPNHIIRLSQESYIDLVLQHHDMDNCNGSTPTPFLFHELNIPPENVDFKQLDDQMATQYRKIIGSLLYAANITRIDICYIIGILARHVNKPFDYHMNAAKKVLRYLKGHKEKHMVFSRDSTNGLNDQFKILIYADSSFADDKSDRHSTSGWVSLISGCPIAWQSKKQSTVALSTTEAELYGLCEGAKEALFMRQWFKHYVGRHPIIELKGDNQGSLYIADHPTSHNRTKHIDIQTYFIREHIKKREITLTYVPTQEQLADILTKPTQRIVFGRLLNKLLHGEHNVGVMT